MLGSPLAWIGHHDIYGSGHRLPLFDRRARRYLETAMWHLWSNLAHASPLQALLPNWQQQKLLKTLSQRLPGNRKTMQIGVFSSLCALGSS